jgi:hypothetical protein
MLLLFGTSSARVSEQVVVPSFFEQTLTFRNGRYWYLNTASVSVVVKRFLPQVLAVDER